MKFEKLCNEVFKNYDVVACVETFADYTNQYKLDGYVSFSKLRKRKFGAKRNSGGILVLIRNSIAKHFKTLNCSSNDTLWLRVSDLFSHGSTIMGVCYCSPINSRAVTGNFYHDLEDNLLRFVNVYPDDKVILLGDFNSRTGDLPDVIGDDTEVTQVFINSQGGDLLHDADVIPPRVNSDKEINVFGRNLITICHEFNLCVCNGRLGNDRNLGTYTCITHNGASVVDYVLVSHVTAKFITNFEVSDISEFSIHFPLTFSLNCRQVPETTSKLVTKKSFQLDKRMKYKWDAQKEGEFLTKLRGKESFLNTLKPTNTQEIDSSVTSFYNIIEECAGDMKTYVSNTAHRKNQGRQQNAPFFDDACIEAKSQMKRSLKNLRAAVKQKRRAEILNEEVNDLTDTVNIKVAEFYSAKNAYKSLVKDKRKKFIQEREALAESLSSNCNEFWSFYKKNKSSNMNYEAIDEIQPDQ